MSPPIRQYSFSSGEISPALYARTDLNRYENGLRKVRNMVVMRQGGITGRPGTQYVSTALNAGNQVRLIPFIFNETGLGQSYVLEFGNQYIAFYQNGGNVISATATITGIAQSDPAIVTAPSHGFSNGDIVTISGVTGMSEVNNGYYVVFAATTNTFELVDVLDNPFDSRLYPAYISGGIASKIYKITSPYLQADLQNIQYAQSADIVTIVHPDYPPMELGRSGATNWALNSIAFDPPVPGPELLGTLTGTPGSKFIGYAITSVNQNGEESDMLQLGFAVHGSLTPPSATTPITISWGQVSGAVYYRVYWDNNPVLIVGPGGRPAQLGFIGQTTQLQFIDSGFTPDYTNVPPLSTQSETPSVPFNLFSELFSTENNYPSTVGFVQQRRAFANTKNNPVGFWLSQPGDFYNFDSHISPEDSDGIIASIAGEQVNAIQHIEELKFMLMLTAGAEIYVQGNGAGVVTPSAINASTQSQYGASALKPLKVADVLIFQQSLGSFIRDFTFDFAIDGYRGNDITIFSSHLFEGFKIVDWCYQKIPDSIIWAVRSDGVLLSCTYVREQEILAWTRHDFTNGFVENIVAIPENGAYAVYASIKRIINGETLRYVERLSSRIWADPVNTSPVQNDPINSSYLDCFIKFDGRNTTSTTMQLLPTLTVIAGVNDGIDWVDTRTGVAVFAAITPGIYTAFELSEAMAAAMNTVFPAAYIAGNNTPGNVEIEEAEANFFSLLFGTGAHKSRSCATLAGWPAVDQTGTHIYTAPTTTAVFPIGPTAYQQPLILFSSVPYFGTGQTAQVGDQIFLEDEEWIQTQGKEGNQSRLIIQSILSSSEVIVNCDTGIVPTEFQGKTITTWARAVKSLSGLGYLAGQTVSVWADRFVVGSPLNNQVSQIYTVTSGRTIQGSIILDKPYSVIYVGLPMTQDVESLDLESYFGETMLAKRKRVSTLAVYFYNTRTVFCGGENPDTNLNNSNDDPLFELYEEKDGTSQATYDVAPELLTEQDYVIIPSRWSKSGRVFMRNVDPVPFSLLALSPRSEDPVQTPYKRP